jgi:hypothetical protein
MFKGGSVIVYDNGCDSQQMTINTTVRDSGDFIGPAFANVIRAPPSNVSDIARHESASWEASRGVYGRLVLDLNNTNYSMGTMSTLFAMSSDDSRAPISDYTRVNAGQFAAATSSYVPAGLGVTVCCFSGLSPETVLTMSTLIYSETAPQLDPSEISLASPSAPYDPEVLRLYRNVSCLLPPGVPVDMNPKGEFWGMVVQGIGETLKFLAPITASIPEVGIPIAAITTAVGNALANKGNKMKEEAKKKQTTPSAKINLPPKKKK